jgi:SAM-dependent methyltransferase
MQQEWEQRARENPRYFICTDVPDSEDEFLASGVKDYELHVCPFLRGAEFHSHEKTALEIGCGMGRMTRCFARDFAAVTALDISPTMIERARELHLPRTRFLVGSGSDLSGVPDRSIDFAFSYIVFQHIPEKKSILRYFEETGRVLRPGGLFRFHVNGLPHVAMGSLVLEGYISQSPRLEDYGLRNLPLIRRRRLGTWLGHPISVGEVRRVCRQAGLELTSVSGRWTAEMWLGGRKHA